MAGVEVSSQPAVLGGRPAVDIPAPQWPVTGQREREWLSELALSGKWSWLGPHEMAFAKEYAEFIGTKYCVCLANGTVTLQCALQALGVGPGDEVIVPGLTWVATAQAAMDVGANVVFADVDARTCCLAPEALRAAITPKTKAVIPVHLYGCMCDMDAIMEIAREHGLKVVEDAAHQQGSRWRETRAGAIGDAGSYSFQQSKILTSGEGGAVTCDDEEVYRCVFSLKQVGWAPDPDNPVSFGEKPKLVRGQRYGHNYRITEMQCALLRAGLERLPAQNAQREEAAGYLREKLAAMGGPLQVVERDERVTEQAYYALTLHFDSTKAEGLDRSQYVQALSAEGAEFGGGYEPAYRAGLLNLYDRTSPIPYRDREDMQDYASLRLPNVERAVRETLVILSHEHLLGGKDYLDEVLAGIRKANDNLGRLKEHFAAEESGA